MRASVAPAVMMPIDGALALVDTKNRPDARGAEPVRTCERQAFVIRGRCPPASIVTLIVAVVVAAILAVAHRVVVA